MDNWNLLLQENQKEILPLYEKLSTSFYSLQSIGIKYRVINNWDKQNLLILNRRNNNAWRKFNWLEWVWLELIVSMRKWGLSLDHIYKIKKQILSSQVVIAEYRIKELEALILLMIYNEQYQFQFIIHENNTLLLENMHTNLSHQDHNSSLHIPLLPILNKLKNLEPVEIDTTQLIIFTKEEKNLLVEMEARDYERVIIFYPNKASVTVDQFRYDDPIERVAELIKIGGYEKLALYKLSGKIIQIKPTHDT